MIFYIVNNLSFLLLIASLCLESGSAYYIASGEINSKKIATACLFWSLLSTVICFLFIVWIPFAGHDGIVSDHKFFIACSAYIFGVLLTTYFRAIFFARQNFFTPNVILLLVNITLIVVILLFGKKQVMSSYFILIYFFSFLVQGLLLVIKYYDSYPDSLSKGLPSLTEIKKIINYSALALMTNIIFFLVYRVDYWFVKKFCDEHDLGNYIQVSKMGQMFLILPAMIASTIFPRTASGRDQEEMKTGLESLSRLLFALSAFLILILILTGQWLFPFVYGPSFDNMFKPFLLLAPGIVALSVLALLTAWYAGKNKIIVNLKGALLALVLIIPADWLLIPRFGIKAAAGASSIGYIVYLIYVLSRLTKEYKTPAKNFFVFRKSDINWAKNWLHKAESDNSQ